MICSCTLYGKSKELTVLQMNIWQEGTMVDGGFDAIADEVSRLSPDIVLFSEVRNYHGKQFIPRILQALKDRGVNYYGETSTLDVGILSKYKIQEQRPNYPLKHDAGSVLKARIEIEGQTIVVYSAHLDYTHYACYLPRGYSGVTWKKLDAPVLMHNRKKHYILEEGIPVPFLIDLGVQTAEGRIVHARYDKFRQINRFLEFVQDILPQMEKGRELTILDFGCGKSYLTFALYYYLKILNGYDIRVIGLDLKEDVIARCNALAEKYGYDKLTFLTGDIADYEGVSKVDMVVTLHACDTATDYALEKALEWDAKVILSVPCCQHELNKQMENEILKPVLKYGLIKERIAALVTDALRAGRLEEAGYQVQILEFIDMEHTPKNILIRAVKTGKPHEIKELDACEKFLGVDPLLGRLKKEKGEI